MKKEEIKQWAAAFKYMGRTALFAMITIIGAAEVTSCFKGMVNACDLTNEFM